MISFIVIGRNEGWKLQKCLQSIHNIIKNDKILDYEIIYVDSQSTDGSVDLALSFDAVRVFRITGECNAAIGRNVGAKESKGEVLFFLDGDMEIHSGFIPLVYENNKLKYPFVSGVLDEHLYDKDWIFIKKQDRSRHRNATVDTYSDTVGGVFIIEREQWEILNGMDNRLTVNEDTDFGLQMSAKRLPLLRKSEYIVTHHMNSYWQRGINLFIIGGKCSALVARKNFLKWAYWKSQIKIRYSSLLLMISMPLFFISMYAILPYITVILLRAFLSKTSKPDYKIKALYYRIVRDVIFVYSFFFRFPHRIKERYIEVKRLC